MKSTINVAIGILLGTAVTCLFSLPGVEATHSPVDAGSDELHMGIGGLTDNRSDACWILEKKDGQTHLALYKMVSGGRYGKLAIQLESVRLIDWDLKSVEMDNMKPGVKKMKDNWEKVQKAAPKPKNGN